jgi:ABC-2 type transport system permease protein/sodium transport system permease protein
MSAQQQAPAERPVRLSSWQTVARVARLARKELFEILRDRRTILTLVLMPLLVYPVLSFAFRQYFVALVPTKERSKPLTIGVTRPRPGEPGMSAKVFLERMLFEAQETQLGQAVAVVGSLSPAPAPGPFLAVAVAHVGDCVREPLVSLPLRYDHSRTSSKPHPQVQIFEVDNPNNSVNTGDIDVAVFIYDDDRRPGQYDLIMSYPAQSLRARQLVDYLQDHVNLASARWQRRAMDLKPMDPKRDFVPVRGVRVMAEPDEAGASALSLTALVPLVLILMTITGAVYPAIDLTAGERERGTLEILVAAPVPRMSLLVAKYVAVVSVAMLTATINLTMMLNTLEFNGLTHEVFKQSGITVQLIVQLLFLLFLFAAFFSAVLLTLTSFARSFKEAQAYLIPLILMSLAPGVMGMMPGLRLGGVLLVTPLVNIVLLARDLSEGNANLWSGMVVVVSTMIYAVTALAGAARIFGAEAVLYSEQSGWADLLRRPSEPQAAPTTSGAMLCLALLFPAFFVAGGLLPSVDVDFSLPYLVGSTILLFAGVPVAALLFGRIRLTSGLQLGRPPWVALPSAALLAFACVPVMLRLLDWMQTAGLTFLATDRLQRLLMEARRMWRGYPVGWVAAAVALIGVAEEVFFRGFLFSALRANAGKRVTIVGSAVLFGLFHFVSNADQLVPSVLMGLLLGWVCWNTRSVLPGMVLHACYNASLILLAFSVAAPPGQRGSSMQRPPPPDPVEPWLEVCAVALGLVGLGLIYWFRVRQRAGAAPVLDLADSEARVH